MSTYTIDHPSSPQATTTIASNPPGRNNPLPIARSTGASYDRPERARTSHACEPCRERKTKCDGERPSCRRCLHTGTNCHYGYGKGWRKRKTAEDLSATARRLARYENLLNDIIPLVSPSVQAMIEEAQEQDAATSNSSEATEGDLHHHMAHLASESSTSSTTSRTPVQLPAPNSHGGPVVRPPTSAASIRTFDGLPLCAPPIETVAAAGVLTRSPVDGVPTRLPSITPHGLLIEPNGRSPPVPLPPVKSGSVLPMGGLSGALSPTSPTYPLPAGEY